MNVKHYFACGYMSGSRHTIPLTPYREILCQLITEPNANPNPKTNRKPNQQNDKNFALFDE